MREASAAEVHRAYAGMFHTITLNSQTSSSDIVSKNPEFKVGDRVRAISESFGWGTVKKGDIGTIIQITSHRDIRVDFPKDKGWRAHEKDLELVEETDPRENTISCAQVYYPFSPEEFLDFKLKREKKELDTHVKSTFVSLPEIKQKKKTIKF